MDGGGFKTKFILGQSRDPEAALHAIQIEPTRAEATAVNFSDQFRVLSSLPLFDDDRPYTRYRVVLGRGDELYWQQTLRAPTVSLTGSANVLSLVLYPKQLTQQRVYDLRIEGYTHEGWNAIGSRATEFTDPQ